MKFLSRSTDPIGNIDREILLLVSHLKVAYLEFLIYSFSELQIAIERNNFKFETWFIFHFNIPQ